MYSPKNFTCPSGKLRTKFTSSGAKSINLGLSYTSFFARCWIFNFSCLLTSVLYVARVLRASCGISLLSPFSVAFFQGSTGPMGPPGDTGSKGTEVSGLSKWGLMKLHVEFKKQKRRHFYIVEMIQKQGEWQALNDWSMYSRQPVTNRK